MPWLLTQVGAAGGETLHSGRLGLRDLGQPCGGDHQNACVGRHVVAAEHRVLGVVEPHHQRADARLHHRSHRLEAGLKVLEGVAASNHEVRESMDAQNCAEHHAKRALRSQPQLVESRTHSRPWPRPWRGERAVGQHHRQAQHHVLDAAVATGLLARGPCRDEAADGRPRQRAREVPQRQAALVQLLLQHHSVHAGLTRAGQVDLIQSQNAIEASHVEHELARSWCERAAHARGAAHRGDRDRVRAGPPKDGDHLLAAGRAGDQHPGTLRTVTFLHETERPEVSHRPLV